MLEAIHHALAQITYQFPKDALARVPPRTLAMMDYVEVSVPPLEGHMKMYDAQCAKVSDWKAVRGLLPNYHCLPLPTTS